MFDPLNVLLLGAGAINFGTTEGPWNHTKRLEKLLAKRLRVVGLVDRDVPRAENALAVKRASETAVNEAYTDTQIFESVDAAGAALTAEKAPHLVVDGLAPIARGTTQAGRDNELRMIRLFPQAAFFIEKPISIASLDEVEEVKSALKGRLVSVGYMLRYLKAARQIKHLLEENNLTVMLTSARYFFAYSFAGEKKFPYWDKSKERGPVASQGTHLVDLVRYFNPRYVPDTVQVQTVEHTDAAGKLSQLQFDEEEWLEPSKRIPRVTNAIWRTETGSTVNFIHGVVLHEGDYDCDVTILADGWKFTLQDPYSTAPVLIVRRPGSAEEVRTVFTDDDCYYSEFEAIVGVIDGVKDRSAILSSYEDAVETYKLTWDITSAGDASYKARLSNGRQ